MSDLYERPLDGRGTVENGNAARTAPPSQGSRPSRWRGYPDPSKISG
jgi:hypothetical protein